MTILADNPTRASRSQARQALSTEAIEQAVAERLLRKAAMLRLEEQRARTKAVAREVAAAKARKARLAAQVEAVRLAEAAAAQDESDRREAADTALPTVVAAPGPNPSPDQNRALARQMLAASGAADKQWPCLNALWTRESGFNEQARNPNSGAGGIPQALPASKMGDGWQASARQQIAWGLSYVQGRYGSPCAALAHSDRRGWY